MYVNGSTTPTYSQTDTVTDAVPGVTLTLNGVTPTNSPVTITTGAPAPNTQSIIQAVQQFVTDYNSAIEGVEGAINTAPAKRERLLPGEPVHRLPVRRSGAGGHARQHPQLRGHDRPALTSGYQSLQELGISTGSSTGSASASSDRRPADGRHRDAHQRDRAEPRARSRLHCNPGRASSRRPSTTPPVRSERSSRASAATTPRSPPSEPAHDADRDVQHRGEETSRSSGPRSSPRSRP